MQEHLSRTLLSALAALALASTSTAADSCWGRLGIPEQDSRWQLGAGVFTGLKFDVNETFRGVYGAQGEDWKQSLAESYSLKDFDVDSTIPTVNLRYTKEWKFITFNLNVDALSFSSDTRARRNYYIGLMDEISYNGRDYDHMMIPEGAPFSVDFAGAFLDVSWNFTPFTLAYGDSLALTPGVEVGLIGVLGQYEIDAGEARGTKIYQDPPTTFVIGGKSSSFAGIGAPFIGANAELRMGPVNGVHWTHKGGIRYFTYQGDTSLFTSASYRKKDLDITYYCLFAETRLDFPFRDGTSFSIGGSVNYFALDGSIKSHAKSDAEHLAARERFDKEIDASAVTILLDIGYAF